MKLITRDTDYALRAVIFMAKKKERVFSVAELSEKLKVPLAFLRKLLQLLHRKGILGSRKGKAGGFWLALPAEKIFLLDLRRIFQGDFSLNQCALKKMACPQTMVCPIRRRLKRIERYVAQELKTITVAGLLDG